MATKQAQSLCLFSLGPLVSNFPVTPSRRQPPIVASARVLRLCRMRFGVVLLCCLAVASAQPLPKFGSYPASVRRPANFAGHYEVSTRPCLSPSGYIEIAIEDTLSGKAYPAGCYWWGYGAYGRKDLPHGAKYRANSRLLIVSGCREVPERACGTFYYEFKNDQLVLLRLGPFRPPIEIE